MLSVDLQQPLVFRPIFMERIWGGRRLATVYGKNLPPDSSIGESWEIVDRANAQSVVEQGPLSGRTLHDLWTELRTDIFGVLHESERFPLLVKVLDATEKLSLQVHPPAGIAAELGGEPKAEFWYIADAPPAAELYLGLTKSCSKDGFTTALQEGRAEDYVHRFPVRTGDAMFLPSGRMHAIGAGNLIIEIQQNSDTTYRVFDWNRTDASGRPRELHVEQSLRSIDFDDHEPGPLVPDGESLVRNSFFQVEKWDVAAPRPASTPDTFAIICCLTGGIRCAGITIRPGAFFLVPACLKDRDLHPMADSTSLLRVTIPRE